MTDHRYPFAALAAALDLPEWRAAKHLSLSGSTEQEYRTRGLTWRVADRLAVKAGFHPAHIWPEWTDHAIADLDVEPDDRPTCEECDEPFEPTNRRQRFCHRRCASRRWQRQKYASDPEWRSEQIEARRQRYVECRDYETARERRRRAANKTVNEHRGAA